MPTKKRAPPRKPAKLPSRKLPATPAKPKRVYPSGRQKENARAAREAVERAAGPILEDYSDLGEPGNGPIGVMSYAHGVLGRALLYATRDRSLLPSQRRKVLVDIGKAIGMTAVRALYDADLAELKLRLGVVEKKGGIDGAQP